ncbi:MAG: hypothetical protein Q7K39_01975 [Candidatus Magasanikbacteria bacterium]|nr:hypothetical protein [Candidatus Magasanikbacteria bacterium]
MGESENSGEGLAPRTTPGRVVAESHDEFMARVGVAGQVPGPEIARELPAPSVLVFDQDGSVQIDGKTLRPWGDVFAGGELNQYNGDLQEGLVATPPLVEYDPATKILKLTAAGLTMVRAKNSAPRVAKKIKIKSAREKEIEDEPDARTRILSALGATAEAIKKAGLQIRITVLKETKRTATHQVALVQPNRWKNGKVRVEHSTDSLFYLDLSDEKNFRRGIKAISDYIGTKF